MMWMMTRHELPGEIDINGFAIEDNGGSPWWTWPLEG